MHLFKMAPAKRNQLLHQVFDTTGTAAGVSYLRLTIGASDLNSFVYSYDDLPEGQTDTALSKFSLSHDYDDVIPVMKEILTINPNIKILASPWSAPTWMKTSNNVRGGSLKKEYYPVYAHYLIKYIQAMKKEGITIDALTVQNEPLNSHNTPSMPMIAQEQAAFIKRSAGAGFTGCRPAYKAVAVRS